MILPTLSALVLILWFCLSLAYNGWRSFRYRQIANQFKLALVTRRPRFSRLTALGNTIVVRKIAGTINGRELAVWDEITALAWPTLWWLLDPSLFIDRRTICSLDGSKSESSTLMGYGFARIADIKVWLSRQ